MSRRRVNRTRRKVNRTIYPRLRQPAKIFSSITKRLARMTERFASKLLRALLRLSRQRRQRTSGFILPTITMIILVVILVISAITIRSFERANNASIARVSEAVLSAAKPTLDRANAKLNYLLEQDPTIPRSTPSDLVLYQALTEDVYTFGDETRLEVRFDIDSDGTVEANGDGNERTLEDNETTQTAWRYPTDTDGNGKFDSYSLYGIYFRSPERDATTGEFNRPRNGLEARTPPMPPIEGLTNAQCAGALGTSASLVGDSGWYQSNGQLRKSFYIFTATIPIDNLNVLSAGENAADFETKEGLNFSGLEYQQDRSRVPLLNNAVVYEDDLEIGAIQPLRFNGRMITNSNLVVTSFAAGAVNLYQVSSINSCFYQEENSKIIVGGNVANGWSGGNNLGSFGNPVGVHLFQGAGSAPITNETISNTDESTNSQTLQVYYNNNAYEQRINLLVNAEIAQSPNEANDPPGVTAIIDRRMLGESSTDPVRRAEIRQEELDTYFRSRTRKVPFGEVQSGANALGTFGTTTVLQGSGATLRPPNAWILPTGGDARVGNTGGPTGLNLNAGQFAATETEKQANLGVENFLGDRILAGNNLPTLRWDDTDTDPNVHRFIGVETPQQIDGTTNWDDPNTELRTRIPRVQELANAGDTGRFGFWEMKAAEQPKTALDGFGGLRVVTGAGVYDRTDSFLPPPPLDPSNASTPAGFYDNPDTTSVTEQYPIVWPDTMPMSPGVGSLVYDNNANDWDTTRIPANATDPTRPDLSDAAYNPNSTIDPNSRKYAKGDLRMRATAVYHYVRDAFDPENIQETGADATSQAPIACISSYYDPTDSITARNPSGTPTLADVSGGQASNNQNNNYVPPGTQPATGKSNNGIVYGPPTTARPTAAATPDATTGLLSGSPAALYDQANLVFPDGRFVNKPLRKALRRAEANRDLADQSAIDAALCSFGILGTTGFALGTKPSFVPDGAIREVALLDARQIKAIDNNPSTPAGVGQYDLATEERQPLEIRATQLDLDALRKQNITADPSTRPGPTPEYLLPNSGVIYATRDDALPDLSTRVFDSSGELNEKASKTQSATDFDLDSSRRPSGIMLINGARLARNDNNNDGHNDTTPAGVEDVVKEKGLILVSDLPVYIQGNFNPHQREEFTATLTNNWGNFYTRTGFDDNFACHRNDPRLANCNTGDSWRPATVLADSISVLSNNFRLGFRNEGDYEIRNNAGDNLVAGYDFDNSGTVSATDPPVNETNLGFDLNGNGNATDAAVTEDQITVAGARQINGFYANNFVTNGLSSGAAFDIDGATVSPTDNDYRTNSGTARNSSYFNNVVTPIQRRGNYPEYVMEICRKPAAYMCDPDDWVVGYDFDGDGNFYDSSGAQDTVAEAGTDINKENGSSETIPEKDIKASTLVITPSSSSSCTTPSTSAASLTDCSVVDRLGAGTTARPPLQQADLRYPRRVAFLRYPATNPASASENTLLLDPNDMPVALGIDSTGNVSYYPYTDLNIGLDTNQRFNGNIPSTTTPNFTAGVPATRANALWYRTTNVTNNPPTAPGTYTNTEPLFYQDVLARTGTAAGIGTVQQPLLVPVLQMHEPTSTTITGAWNGNSTTALRNNTRWMPQATNTTFNLVFGSGDSPPRAFGNPAPGNAAGETNGGLQNFPRFLENWFQQTAIIKGSFIQLGRSEYGTGAYQPVRNSAAGGLFGYRQNYNNNVAGGRVPYFSPPNRDWGYDVGLLSQPPDLFAQTFTLPPSNNRPSEFFREVSRDDEWVQTLLCARLSGTSDNAVPDAQRPSGCPDS